ncbi:MAG: OmpA family protein [Treponema sp.]|nr:OmpA family protein [Treponema sp.]
MKRTPRKPVLHSSFLIPHCSFAKASLAFFIFHFTILLCSAQSTAVEIETLLETSAVTNAQAAWFLLSASETMSTSDHYEAFRYAHERQWLPKDAVADSTARLDAVSLLLMRSFNINGGFMYSRLKNSHYAYRELTYKNILQGRIDPAMDVSGAYLLFITSRLLSARETAALAAENERQRLLALEQARAEEQARLEAEALARREALSAEISEIIEEQQIENVTVEATNEGVMIRLSDIQFLANSSELPDSEKRKLDEIANILRDIPGVKIQVEGHTAMAGTPEGRLLISRQRAQAVADYLILLRAVSSANVTVVGRGADRSVGDNSTIDGMAANRRVEITILEN